LETGWRGGERQESESGGIGAGRGKKGESERGRV